MITLTIDFNMEKIPHYVVVKNGNSLKVRNETFDEVESLSDWLNVQLEQVLLEERPNLITVKIKDDDRFLQFIKFGIFNETYLFRLLDGKIIDAKTFLVNIREKVTSQIHEIISDLPFYEKQSNNIHTGELISKQCDICNSPLFYDHFHDALICLTCDKWITSPVIGDDYENDRAVYPPEQPSQRSNFWTLDESQYSQINDMESPLSIILWNKIKRNEYRINRRGISDFIIENGVDKDIQFNSIPTLIEGVTLLVERLPKWDSKITEIRHLEYKINNKPFSTNSTYKTGTDVLKIRDSIAPTILGFLIESKQWIASE